MLSIFEDVEKQQLIHCQWEDQLDPLGEQGEVAREAKAAPRPCSRSSPSWNGSQRHSYVHKEICTRMFVTALFEIVKQIRKNVTIDRKMGKLTVMYLYNRILHSNGSECIKALCINTDKSQNIFWAKKIKCIIICMLWQLLQIFKHKNVIFLAIVCQNSMKDSMGMIEIIFRMKFTSWHVQCFNSLKKKWRFVKSWMDREWKRVHYFTLFSVSLRYVN